ncbi:F-box/FBD/LRR-repeat protein At1g13570-like [Rutidosis leptorrhynchoides]|uniref:F-box/FBD/LRR-repeat protein At1g13570-like n=1 Tax=Rutidosis leptorrhynchoides TaxID=125765 RepID=UPI003A9A5D19
MIGKPKRKMRAEKDRLSKLPEYLIDSILERVPVEDALRTSGLSRLQTNCFNFLEGPILNLHLHIPKNVVLNNFQDVNQWIFSLSRKHNGLRELVLTNSNKLPYQLPSYLFHCSELRKLHLKNNCIFKPPPPPPPFEDLNNGFPYLNDLSLAYIAFEANLGETVIKLPQLEKLKLFLCTNVYNFNITATKLKSLRVVGCHDAKFIRLLDSQRLTDIDIIVNKPIPIPRFEERVNLATMLSNLPYLVALSADGCFLKLHLHLDLDMKPALAYLEAASSSDCFDETLNRLKTIRIRRVAGSRPVLLLIKLLLDHSPNLEMISIEPRVTADDDENDKFLQDVMRFPRASSKAQLRLMVH